MNKYLLGFAVALLFIGAGCNLNSQTQLESQMEENNTSGDGAMIESDSSVSGETMLKDDAQDSDAMVDVQVDGDAMVKIDPSLDTQTELDTKLELMQKNTDVMDTEESTNEAEEGQAQSAGTYEDYSPSKLALASKGRVVLFFKANWCPTCIAFDKSVSANLSAIPAGTHILKIDYDNSSELKKKYGVTYQHTFVQVNAQGNMITKWSGSTNLADLVSHLK